MVSLLSRLIDVPLVFLDVETTGASPDYGDRVIELGMIRVENGQVVGIFDHLINPRRSIGAGITALTGISMGMVADKPVFQELAPKALEFMSGAALVGHNIPFDLSFLRAEFRKSSVDLPAALPGAHVLDTCRIARRRFGRGGNGLQNLATRFACKCDTAHRALADSQTTHRVLNALLEPVNGWQLSLLDTIQSQGGPIKLAGQPKANLLPLELEEALDLARPVEMEYVDARESRSWRVVTPLEVRRFKGEMMLVAWCDLRKDRRTFKLDRIVQLKRIDPDGQVAPATVTATAPAEDVDLFAQLAAPPAKPPKPDLTRFIHRASDLAGAAPAPSPTLLHDRPNPPPLEVGPGADLSELPPDRHPGAAAPLE